MYLLTNKNIYWFSVFWIFVIIKIPSLLKQGHFCVQLLSNSPDASFFLNLSARTSTFYSNSKCCLSLVFFLGFIFLLHIFNLSTFFLTFWSLWKSNFILKDSEARPLFSNLAPSIPFFSRRCFVQIVHAFMYYVLRSHYKFILFI